MVRIRLKRLGRRNRPFYRINAIDKRTQRDGKVLEYLGWYDPIAPDAAKQVHLNAERIKYWLGQGATASDTVNDLLADASIIDAAKWSAERKGRVKKNYAAAIKVKQAAAAAPAPEAKAEAKAEG